MNANGNRVRLVQNIFHIDNSHVLEYARVVILMVS